MDYEIRKNQFLFDDFIVSAKKPEVSDKNRFVVNLQQKKIWESNLEKLAYSTYDIGYSRKLKSAIEIASGYDDEPMVSYLGEDSKTKSILREISTFWFSFPFMAFCKGGQEIIISNMHYTDEPVEFHYDLKDSFICWIDPDSHSLDGFQTSALEAIKLDEIYQDLEEAKAK